MAKSWVRKGVGASLVQRRGRHFIASRSRSRTASHNLLARAFAAGRPIAESKHRPDDCRFGVRGVDRSQGLPACPSRLPNTLHHGPAPLTFPLNERSARLCDELVAQAERLRCDASLYVGGARVIDLGINVPGGLEAGLLLARICLADLADVKLVPGRTPFSHWQAVAVTTDQPVAACLASQYAGWELKAGKFFALGSGPMRAAAAREPLFEKIGYTERPERVVGVLETRQLPTVEIVEQIAEACQVPTTNVTLLVAPTASLAGGLQIVARSIETGLHKLGELGCDVRRVVSAAGQAPLPPVAADDLKAIGRTNDAILYGGEVTFWVEGIGDDELTTLGPQVPSSSSGDHGARFAELFERYDRNFYAIDPLLFSPAVVVFQNLTTGRSHRFGHLAPEVVAQSFEH
ncbi:MAG: methenyltetrahydromethanopterin cyclohydrolase [Planctomycetes bacterium]|nr:methenyltetrahydromethanopterin cyclohydrolase [Planctomycetota bacterium]